MKDKLSYSNSFVGKKIVFDVGWFDYRIGTVKLVEVPDGRYDSKIKLVVEDILNYDRTHREGRPSEFVRTEKVLVVNYLNYHCQRWGMWALADSKAGKDLVQRIERTWDRKPKPECNPYGNPNLLEKRQAKYYNLVKEHQSAGLPIYVRTKYRDSSIEYRLEKVESNEYELEIVHNKAFVIFKNIAYAHRVKATNFNKKYFFEEM